MPQGANPLRGILHQNSKFTEEQVAQMREMRSSGMTCSQIVQSIGLTCSYKSVWRIVSGGAWSHMPNRQPLVYRPAAKSPEERRKRHSESAKKWRINNPEKALMASRENSKKQRLKPGYAEHKRAYNERNKDMCIAQGRKALCKRHGITIQIYNEFLAKQGGVCAICGEFEKLRSGNMCIDHDHRHCPGQYGCAECIRGLLCSGCNQGIGCMKDSPDVLKKAAEYIQSHGCIIAPRPTRETMWHSGDHELLVIA